MDEETVLDRLIGQLSEADQTMLDRRYGTLVVEPRKLKFIDRLVADSRTVALNHTAGLSTPQQVQMALFSLFTLIDESAIYKNSVKKLLRRREAVLFQELEIETDQGGNGTYYYTLLDLESISTSLYGREFALWMLARKEPLEMLFRLADEGGVVLLPGKGFGALHPSARASLANLDECDYMKMGHIVRKIADEYYKEFSDIHMSPRET